MNKKLYSGLTYSRKLMQISILTGSILVTSCGDGSPKIKGGTEKTVYEATKGTITELEEVEPGGDYKILDERLIDDREKSIAIVHALDGTIDTLALGKMEKDTTRTYRRHSSVRSILYYGIARSYFSRDVSGVAPNSSYYKNETAYNKSTGLKNDLKTSASTRKVTVPGASSKGYGSGKSFRSFGG